MLSTIKRSPLKVIYISVLVSVFLVGVFALVGSARESSPVQEQVLAYQVSVPAFTLSTSRELVPAGGHERLLSTQQRFQRSDGTYKLVQTAFTLNRTVAATQTLFGFVGLGVFRLDEGRKRLVFVGPQTDDRASDVAGFLRAHELFAREESVAGVSTVVWRQPARDKEDFLEEYRAPSLGGLLIKRVKVSARGRETVEPTALQIGEPTSGLFGELFSYPADYSNYERQIHEKARTEPEKALLMQQALARVRQAKP
jgi:hypothetical protein